ncbi:hypothetical protein ACWA1F_06410 [Flavobacterium sp. 3-218]
MKFKSKIKVFLVVLFMIQSIHSSAQLPSETMKISLSYPEIEGMIVGTIAVKNQNNKKYKKVFSLKRCHLPFKESRRATDSLRKKGVLSDIYDSVTFSAKKCDFEQDGQSVYFFSIVKPRGDYRFYVLQIIGSRGFIAPVDLINLDISFSIEPGTIKYLGEISYDEKNGTIEVIDQRQRDQLVLKEKFPMLKF